jgi:hypothetical protein
MKLPHRILQFGTLALFSSMIGSLVVYRGVSFESIPIQSPATLKRDSLPEPWFDSIQFQQILRETIQSRLSSASPQQKRKRKRNRVEPEVLEIKKHAYQGDTIVAMKILHTRYAVAHLSPQEVLDFQQMYAAIIKDKENPRMRHDGYYLYRTDSTDALNMLRYGPQHYSNLSEEERLRFKIVWDSLNRPRMMSSKTGIIFFSSMDTTRAIQIVKSEKSPK